jgi:hypothetical protein
VRQLYRRYVGAFVRLVRPEAVTLASETNLLRIQAPASVYAGVVAAANEAAAEARAQDPALRLMITVQVDVANGRLPGGVGAGLARDRADFQFVQALGLSSYPFLAGVGDPEQLPLDYYSRLTAEAPGFKKFVWSGLTLSAGAHPVIDMRLDVGAVVDTVEVHADAPILETANPTVGQVITSEEVESFPVNGRTPMMLANLALGVISTFEPGPVRPFDNGAPNSISIGGAPSGRNEVLLNGAPNAGFSNQMAYSPPQDAVTEVRVSLFDMDASFGHTMGGTVNLVTKAATDELRFNIGQATWLGSTIDGLAVDAGDLAVKVKPVLLPVRSPTLFKPLHVVRRRNSETVAGRPNGSRPVVSS